MQRGAAIYHTHMKKKKRNKKGSAARQQYSKYIYGSASCSAHKSQCDDATNHWDGATADMRIKYAR